MNDLAFFIPVSYGSESNSFSNRFREIVEDYFYLKGKKAVIIKGRIENSSECVQLVDSKSNTCITAIKVLSFFTIAIPVIMMSAKCIIRLRHGFKVIDAKKEFDNAVVIQKVFKGRVARQRYKKALQSITAIQSAYRKHLCRKKFQNQKSSAIKIQRLYKTRIANLEFIKMKKSAVSIQSHFKGYFIRKLIKEFKRKNAAIKIQKVYRGHRDRLRVAEIEETHHVSVIEDHVRSCGNKHDNLIKAKELLDSSLAEVPLFFGITDSQIKSYFSEETKRLWESIQYKYLEKTGSLHDIKHDIKKDLDDIKKSIIKDIISANIRLSYGRGTIFYKMNGKKIIVRSSSNEDDKQFVNAGGNLSIGNVEANKKELKIAVADVVASYFSYVSFKARINAKDNPFRHMPICSVLVMEHIIEDDKEYVSSGVMMTHKPSYANEEEERVSYITSSWGSGSGVVSGKVSQDEFILTENHIYKSIHEKSFREVDKTHCFSDRVYIRHDKITNDERRNFPTLTDSQLNKLRTIADTLERSFGNPLDIEFVVKNDKIFIVQVRPANEQDNTSATFLDSRNISIIDDVYYCETIVPIENKVLSISWEEIIFADSLHFAELFFIPKKHKAVVVHTKESSNTHPAVNFASLKIPCFYMPLSHFKEFNNGYYYREVSNVNLCQQTGIVVVSGKDFPTHKGLIRHPISSLPISVAGNNKFSKPYKTNPLVTKVLSSLKQVPQEIVRNFSDIESNINELLSQINTLYMEHIEQSLSSLKNAIEHELEQIRINSEKEHYSMVSFHAGILMQLLDQSSIQVIGAYGISTLLEETHLPECIKKFLEKNNGSKLLCDLSLCGKKAFDENLKLKWLSFLEANKDKEDLLTKLIDQIGILDSSGALTLWFFYHFSNDLPDIEKIIFQKESEVSFFQQGALIKQEIDKLAEKINQIDSKEKLLRLLEELFNLSQESLMHGNIYRDLSKSDQEKLYNLVCSEIYVNLVNLWDLNIKNIMSSHFLSVDEKKEVINDKINLFAEFVLHYLSIINPSSGEASIIKRMFGRRGESIVDMEIESSRRRFNVNDWLYPQGCTGDIKSEDQRLSVIHQNSLQASIEEGYLEMLPQKLADAFKIFQDNQRVTRTKRFITHRGNFVFFSEKEVSLRINIPLNYHSCVVTLSQKKETDDIKLTFLMRGSDNHQGRFLDYFKVLSALTGIKIDGHEIVDPSFEITFTVKNDDQLRLLSKSVDFVNDMSLTSINYMNSLVGIFKIWGEKKFVFNGKEVRKEEIEDEILQIGWDHLISSGLFTSVVGFDQLFMRESYFHKAIERGVEELDDKKPKAVLNYIRDFELYSGHIKIPQELEGSYKRLKRYRDSLPY